MSSQLDPEAAKIHSRAECFDGFNGDNKHFQKLERSITRISFCFGLVVQFYAFQS